MTSVKIFFKHLFMSIKRRPAQPILLIFVLTLAVVVSICAVDIDIYLPENIKQTDLAKMGSSDYILSVNSQSSSRFLTEKEVKEILPDGVESCGVFGVPMLYGAEKNFVYGVGTDLSAVETVFDVTLTRSLPLPTNKRKEGIYVTEKFAEKYGTDVGGKVTFSVFGKEKTFFVYGLSATDLLGKYDALFDISAVQGVLQQNSAFLAYLGDDFSPVSEIYIKTNGKADETKSVLQARYPDMSLVTSVEKSNQNMLLIDEAVSVMVVLAVFFSSVVIYCCFNILSTQRREETNLFYGVGAKSYMLNWLSAAELTLYWAVAAVFGILLSLPLGKMIIDASDLAYCTLTVHPQSIVIALAVTLFATEFSLAIFVIADAWKKKKARKKIVHKVDTDKTDAVCASVFGGTTAVVLGVTFIPLNSDIKMVLSVLSFFLVCLCGFFLGKRLIKIIAAKEEKKEKHGVPYRYACKNIRRVKTLGNTVGLVGVFFTVLMSLMLLYSQGDINMTVLEETFRGDYYALNASADGAEKLRATEGVEKVVRMYQGNGLLCGDHRVMVYVDDLETVIELYPIERLPEENEIFLPNLLADLYMLRVGDTVEVTFGDKTYEFVYTYRVETADTFCFVNTDIIGIGCDTLLIRGEEGYDKEQLYNNIMQTLACESATAVSKEGFYAQKRATISGYMFCGKILIVFVVAFAVVGMADNIAASYRSRREEFLCYGNAGMSRQDIRKTQGAEVGLCVGVGVLTFAILAVPTIFIIRQACSSFTVDILYNIKAWFLMAFDLL